MLNVTPSLARSHGHGTPQSPTGSRRVNIMAHRPSSNWSLLVSYDCEGRLMGNYDVVTKKLMCF